MNEFQHIVDELDGKRCVFRKDGTVLIHYGNVEDPQDPRWFAVEKGVALAIEKSIARAHCFSLGVPSLFEG